MYEQDLSPLEHVSMSNSEGFHSSFLCWLLGEDSVLPLKSKVAILEDMCGTSFDSTVCTSAQTEARPKQGPGAQQTAGPQ